MAAIFPLFGWAVPYLPYLDRFLRPHPAGLNLNLFCINFVVVLLLLLIRWMTRRARTFQPRPLPRRILAAGSYALVFLGLVGWLYAVGYCRVRVEAAANKLLRAGIDAYERADADEALERWQAVTARYPFTSAWGKAIFNTGMVYKEQHRYEEAIGHFERLFPSHVDDHESGAGLMEVYRNYRHRACLEISSCYEARGDYAAALHHARRAKTEYRYQSWCLTCRASAGRELAKRIECLEILAANDR
jgi:tetratricopeptide (TPR) repeat protein